MGLRLERADPVGGTPRCGVGMMSPVGPQTALLWDREQLRAQGSGLGIGDWGWGHQRGLPGDGPRAGVSDV